MKEHLKHCRVLAIAAVLFPSAALAGPRCPTDDPEPTDTGHWKIYLPLLEGAGAGSDYHGAIGTEINYGVAPDVQLTVGPPGRLRAQRRPNALGRRRSGSVGQVSLLQ